MGWEHGRRGGTHQINDDFVASFTFVHDLDASLWWNLASGSRRDVHDLECSFVELELAFSGIQIDLNKSYIRTRAHGASK